MNIETQNAPIQTVAADAIIVNLFEATQQPTGATGAVDKALGGAITALIQHGDLKGQVGEVSVLYPRGEIPARRVLVVGLGKAQDFTLTQARKASAAACRRARALGARSIASIVHGAGSGQADVSAAAQATVEGALLGLYDFRAHKTQPPEYPTVEMFTLVEFDADKMPLVQAGARVGSITAQAANLTRDLVNQPSNYMTPMLLAEAAQRVASESGLQCEIYDAAWMQQHKMGALLGVTKGSDEPPRFIILEHGRGRSAQPIVFVGKGITFDSGGISIKAAEGMEAMKNDMGGAAAVIGALCAIGQLDLPLHVIGLAPACENLPSGRAYKPGDVLRARNGKTIEVISTDAEGRLILADALCYAADYQPAAVIDLATLTGACVIALGRNIAAGLFCTDETLGDELRQAGAHSGERVWPLPLLAEYRQVIKSEVADVANHGGRYGGVGASAVFLQEFVSYPWAHVDIAGMVSLEKDSAEQPKGATGFGVRLLVEFARRRCDRVIG